MNQNPKALLALIAVCLIWGTTYYALRIGVAGFPAFLFSGIRQVSAGLLLVLFLAMTKKLKKLSWSDVGKQLIPGVLMITIGNGVIGWAEIYIPSGLAAMIVAIMPVSRWWKKTEPVGGFRNSRRGRRYCVDFSRQYQRFFESELLLGRRRIFPGVSFVGRWKRIYEAQQILYAGSHERRIAIYLRRDRIDVAVARL